MLPTLISLLRLPSRTQNFGTKAWLLLYMDKEFGIGMICGVQKCVFLFGLGRMVVIVFWNLKCIRAFCDWNLVCNRGFF